MTSAIKSYITINEGSLKNDYLLFDDIFTTSTSYLLLTNKESSPNLAEYRRLFESGTLKRLPALGKNSSINQKEITESNEWSKLIHYWSKTRELMSKTDTVNFDPKRAMNLIVVLDLLESRMLSILSSFDKSSKILVPIVPTVSIYDEESPFRDSPRIENTDDYIQKTNVLNCIIDKFPRVTKDIPWESLIDFKNDPETSKKLTALRSWVIDVSKTNLKPYEIHQKLEHLINEYESHMKFHTLKFETGTFEVFVTTALDFLGNIASLKWGEAASKLFALRRKELELFEAELNAPGREIAYISSLKNRFE